MLSDEPTAGGKPCCAHDPDEHDPDEGCLHGWTETLEGCPCRQATKAPAAPVSVFDRIAVQMAASGATGFHVRRVAGSHDRRWRRNR
jgi:hypothetical protein